MNIRIDDDVPLPQPDKADTWVTGKPKPKSGLEGWQKAIRETFTPEKMDERTRTADPYLEGIPRRTEEWQAERYPAETTYDAKGVPTVDCFLVGGPLNGKHGPIVSTAKVVELEVYASDGSIETLELYELGERGDLGCRYHLRSVPVDLAAYNRKLNQT